MDRKFLLFRRGSFMGQFFLYRANFEIKKKGKRPDFQALIIHTSLPSSYEENDPFEENFFRPLPESTKEEYEIKSIIPKGKDLPISTKEKDVFPTLERRYRSQLNIHQRNTGFTDRITIRRKPFLSNVTKLRDTTRTYLDQPHPCLYQESFTRS